MRAALPGEYDAAVIGADFSIGLVPRISASQLALDVRRLRQPG
jgi:hypothetical protein